MKFKHLALLCHVMNTYHPQQGYRVQAIGVDIVVTRGNETILSIADGVDISASVMARDTLDQGAIAKEARWCKVCAKTGNIVADEKSEERLAARKEVVDDKGVAKKAA